MTPPSLLSCLGEARPDVFMKSSQDLISLELPGAQMALARAVLKATPATTPVVVVLVCTYWELRFEASFNSKWWCVVRFERRRESFPQR